MSTDAWLALGVCVFVALIFAVSLRVPRNVRPVPSTDRKIDDTARKIQSMEERLVHAEHDLRNVRMIVNGLATKESVNRIEVQVAEMRGEVKGLVNNTAATTRSIERIEGFLMTTTAEVIATAKSVEAKT